MLLDCKGTRRGVTEENSNISWHCRCCVVVLTAGARSSEGWTDREGRAAGEATPQCVLFPEMHPYGAAVDLQRPTATLILPCAMHSLRLQSLQNLSS